MHARIYLLAVHVVLAALRLIYLRKLQLVQLFLLCCVAPEPSACCARGAFVFAAALLLKSLLTLVTCIRMCPAFIILFNQYLF